MKIMLSGGGTAGHVYPALAMAESISEKYPDAEFVFVGREGGEESSAAVKAGYKLYTLRVEGITRKITLKNVGAAVKALTAIRAAKSLIREIKPDMVIGTGGYVCWPVLKAASALGVTAIIHEANAYPGLVTRLVAKRCDAVLLGFDEAKEHIRGAKRIYTVGNPVRASFSRLDRDSARRALGIAPGELFILSFGGSLGAERINEAVVSWMKYAESQRYRIRHLHASGRRYHEDLAHRFHSPGKGAFQIVPYIDNMPLYLSAADLAVTRSGAMTLAELSATATPSVLIPSPNVTNDHQHKNALEMQKAGKAILISENELSSESLTAVLRGIYKKRDKLSEMRAALLASGGESATERFMQVFDEIYKF